MKFHEKLEALSEKTIEMGNYSLKMLEDSVKALKERNGNLADEIYERRRNLADYDTELEERTLKLLTLHQPMATDMRRIACILKMLTYLYRIGRYGKDIAKIAMKFTDKPHFKKLVSIKAMSKIVIEMIQNALDAFKEGDLNIIEQIEEMDDEVDELRYSIFREVVSYMIEDTSIITQGAHYLMASRYLERCGDHACKMAEKIHYMVNGRHVEIK